ncbi:metal ABC transporter ATP-binding protein [Halonatronum saccharophilum]|uniref:metal ABC transporter ATP-binding protein n=1 Tax=Halonatronum saccharophilum TaxID=150060 RepID=UPI000488A7AB|nr:metal ABC transporter ATP-binding protein [Halonatronum saccharophilum]
MEEEVIGVKNLSFKYEDKIILDNIDLKINEGDFVAFVGPNGSGKSTLLKLLVGSLKSRAGEVKILGKPIKGFKDWKRIGYVSQNVRSFNESFPATVGEIVGANLYSRMGFFKFLTKGLHKKVDEALELVDMIDYKDRLIGDLSGGQQQRVFIARTLVNEVEIIFLDEPLVGVDAKVQDSFYELLASLNRRLGLTIVMISHDINMISNKADKIVCFADKKIYTHRAEEFDYLDYLNVIKGNNSMVLPKHEHKGVN